MDKGEFSSFLLDFFFLFTTLFLWGPLLSLIFFLMNTVFFDKIPNKLSSLKIRNHWISDLVTLFVHFSCFESVDPLSKFWGFFGLTHIFCLQCLKNSLLLSLGSAVYFVFHKYFLPQSYSEKGSLGNSCCSSVETIWLGCRFDPWLPSVGQGSGIAMSYGVSHRLSSDPVLLWLWYRPAAVAPIWSLAWDLPCAAGAALKSQINK